MHARASREQLAPVIRITRKEKPPALAIIAKELPGIIAERFPTLATNQHTIKSPNHREYKLSVDNAETRNGALRLAGMTFALALEAGANPKIHTNGLPKTLEQGIHIALTPKRDTLILRRVE